MINKDLVSIQGSKKNNNKLEVLYVNKKIYFSNLHLSEKKNIKILWKKTRINYLKLLKKIKNKKVNNKFITELFQWQGISTWWFTLVELKDTESDNCWIKKLFLIHLFVFYSKKKIKVTSDDKQINKILIKNFKKIRLNKVRSSVKLNYFFINFLSLSKSIYTNFRTFFIFTTLNILFGSKKKIIHCQLWVYSLFPANWSLSKKNNNNDRFFENFFFKNSKIKKNYLLSFDKYQKNVSSIYNDCISIRKKVRKNFYFIDFYISIFDLVNIYFTTLKEYISFLKLKRNISFYNNINVKGINVSEIFLSELGKSFFGFIQDAKYKSLALKNFLSNTSDQQNFITYGELIASIRPLYFFIKQHSKKNKIITFQHATHYENKLIVNHNKSDFLNTGEKPTIYNLVPDLYMVHGKHFEKILLRYYPGKVIVSGSLKYNNIIDKIKSKNKIKNIIKKKLKINTSTKIILLAPSTHDVENIFEILKNFKCETNFQIVLSPHPGMNLIQLKKYQEFKYPNLKIIYVDQFKTLDLVCASDLIVTSASSIAVEALMFNKISVRFMSLGDVPKFDYERNIPTFYSSDEFNNWFKKNIKLEKLINKKKIMQKYFTKIDAKINVRFDKHISEVINY